MFQTIIGKTCYVIGFIQGYVTTVFRIVFDKVSKS